jgi:serine/threonine protein kinase
MHYAFEDAQNLYLVIDLMSGGDLRYHIGKHRKFSEEQTSKNVTFFKLLVSSEFFVACMLLCLEYLHKHCILHRDIKPENLVFDESGYLRITDLGIARVWNPENSKDTSGTPGYMAPEVMCR